MKFTLYLIIYLNIFELLGPPVVPIVGSGFSFKYDRSQGGFEIPAQTMHRLGKKYGPVMRMQMGSDHYVFLNGTLFKLFLINNFISRHFESSIGFIPNYGQ